MKRKLRYAICLALAAMLCCMAAVAAPAVLKRGDSGTDVERLQSRLKNWGYYNGSVDGIFGSSTEAAVKLFQRRNGITADGIVGTQTAKKVGITISSGGTSSGGGASGSSANVNLLARVVHAEARGEPYTGKVAVAAVVLNRVRSSMFPNTITGVIYQKNAFTCVADGQINLQPNDEAIRAARDALNGWDPSGGALYYYNPAIASSSWIFSRKVITTIGRHRFAV